MKIIEGKGRTEDRSSELLEAIIKTIYEVGEGISVAAVIGCLDIAKDVIKEQQSE